VRNEADNRRIHLHPNIEKHSPHASDGRPTRHVRASKGQIPMRNTYFQGVYDRTSDVYPDPIASTIRSHCGYCASERTDRTHLMM
jgi:hypothetical protein